MLFYYWWQEPVSGVLEIFLWYDNDPKKYNNLNSESFLLPCVDGELLLFPSNLQHSVPTNMGKEARISLSFNTFSVDTLGSKDSLTHLDIRRIMNEHN